MEVISSQIRAIAEELSIDAVGYASLQGDVEASEMATFDAWLERGQHATMDYLERYRELRRAPKLLLPEAKSVIVVAISYYPEVPQAGESPRIARYALGRDYHKVVKQVLLQLAERIGKEVAPHTYRAMVDTAPFLERYWAERSGIGLGAK